MKLRDSLKTIMKNTVLLFMSSASQKVIILLQFYAPNVVDIAFSPKESAVKTSSVYFMLN